MHQATDNVNPRGEEGRKEERKERQVDMRRQQQEKKKTVARTPLTHNLSFAGDDCSSSRRSIGHNGGPS
jgi:hypothetical protein